MFVGQTVIKHLHSEQSHGHTPPVNFFLAGVGDTNAYNLGAIQKAHSLKEEIVSKNMHTGM